MSEKSVSPLNNPSSEKSATPNIRKTSSTTFNDIEDGRGERKIVKKPLGGVKMAEALLKCPRCGRIHKLIFRFGMPPNWERCTWCNELQPTDGYKVLAYGLGLPQPKTRCEIEATPYYLAEAKK